MGHFTPDCCIDRGWPAGSHSPASTHAGPTEGRSVVISQEAHVMIPAGWASVIRPSRVDGNKDGKLEVTAADRGQF